LKKAIILFIISILFFNLIIISPKPFNILTPAQALKYSQNTNLTNVDASFIGEDIGDDAGSHAACAGDVNGDGFDDFLISAMVNGYEHLFCRCIIYR
jgi:hypothetical protein